MLNNLLAIESQAASASSLLHGAETLLGGAAAVILMILVFRGMKKDEPKSSTDNFTLPAQQQRYLFG